jgi:hypothetical protein
VDRLGLTWSAGARLLYTGGVRGYDAAGIVVAEESYYDLAFTTGLGRRFESLGIAIGAGATYLREHLAVEDGDGFTFSLGASYAFRGHRLDIVARDLGGRLTFDDRAYDIDERLILGYGYRFFQNWGTLGMGTQVTLSQGEFRRLDAGVSYDPNRYLTLRTGLGHDSNVIDAGNMPVTAGLGIHVGDVAVDYAFTPRQYFGDTHTFSIGFAFGARSGPSWSQREATAPVFASSPAAPPVDAVKPPDGAGGVFLIVGGTHNRMESAEAEVRALELLQIPATAEAFGEQFRVIIDRFEERSKAVDALRRLRYQGYQFAIVVEKGRS